MSNKRNAPLRRQLEARKLADRIVLEDGRDLAAHDEDDELVELAPDEPAFVVTIVTVDGKEVSAPCMTDDPPVVLFADIPFFDFGAQLVAVERVQSLTIAPSGD